MKKDDIMSHLMGMIPLDSTKEVIELWCAIARISYILDEILPESLKGEKMNEFAAKAEKYSLEFIKTRFPHHVKEDN